MERIPVQGICLKATLYFINETFPLFFQFFLFVDITRLDILFIKMASNFVHLIKIHTLSEVCVLTFVSRRQWL